MDNLKKKILEFTKENQANYSLIERKAGLTKNFISNLIYGKSKNPGILSIIKLANALDISIDTLVGEDKHNAPLESLNIVIHNQAVFIESTLYVLDYIKNKQISIDSLSFFKAIMSIYNYSNKRHKIDKKFADWYIETYLKKG